MKKINIIGNPIGSSGYAVHTRYLANSLKDKGYDVRIDAALPHGWERQVTDSELNMLTKEYDENCTSIFIGQPPFWRLALADNPKHFIGYLVWEGDRIPEYWIEYLVDELVEQIWVPSIHVKRAIINTCDDYSVIDKIRIVPHGIDLSLFNINKSKRCKDLPFTFCCNKGWRGGIDDRGGVQYLLKAFAEEFKPDEDVRLMLKLNPAYCPPEWNFREEMSKIGIETSTTAPILFNTDNVDYKEIYKFYSDCDVFVCPTRSEGFNLPGLEAKAIGLITVQTGYGGQLDYMDDNTDLKINYKLEYSNDPAYEGIKWATPDVKDLKKVMRACFEKQDEVRKKSPKSAKQATKFAWDETAKLAKKYLNELK